jgi:eukaryotic-like serine/threonine-protein kinase
MSQPRETDQAEEWLERMLIACEESRAAGLSPPDLASLFGDEPSQPEVHHRLGDALATLALLRMRWSLAPDTSGPDVTPAAPGMSLGRYEILSLLGAGGHGIVFLAYDPSLRRKVALKVPRLEALACPELRERFLREARAVARLDHPGIVPIHDFGSAGPVSYLATAYVDGPNLADWLDSRKESLEPEIAAHLILSLTEAVAHAHARGVLHRDLKPANVLLESTTATDGTSAPAPRISDFGLAKLLDETGDRTRTGALRLGTPGFAAPELSAADGARIGPATDVYSLGAILHTLLTGQPPDGRVVIDRGGVTGAPDSARPLRKILAGCLQARPEDRYPTAEALAGDLRRFLAGRPVRAQLLTRRRLQRIGSRGGRIMIAAAVLLLAGWIGSAARSPGRPRATDPPAPGPPIIEDAALARRKHYVADFQRAFRFVHEDQNVQEAERILDRCHVDPGQDDPRGFEWGYLKRLAHREVMTLRHDRGDVYCVRFSADGRTLASAGLDGTARIWEAATGRLRSILPHPKEVNWIELSPDDRLAATAADDGVIRLWDVETGRAVGQPLPGHSRKEAVCVRFTPDGKRLVSGGRDGRLVLWDVATGRVLNSRPSGLAELEGLDIPRDGSRIYTVGSGMHGAVGVFTPDLTPSRPLSVNGSSEVAFVVSVAVSRDNRRVAAAVANEGGGYVIIWDPSRTDFARSVPSHSDRTYGLEFGPDGSLIATAGEGRDPTVRLWEVNSGRLRDVFMGHTDRVWCVTFSPDGRRLASASRDGTIKLWDVIHRADPTVIASMGAIPSAVGFTSDSEKLIVQTADGLFSTYSAGAESPSTVRDFVPPTASFAGLSVNGRMLARGYGYYRVFVDDIQEGRAQLEIATRASWGLHCLTFSPDEHFLLIPDYDSLSLRVFATPLGDRSCASRKDSEGWSIPLATLKINREGWSVPPEFAFTTDSRALVFSTGSTLAIWRFAEDRLRVSDAKAPGAIIALTLSPDGRHVATADRSNSIQIRDVATLEVRTERRMGLGADVKVLAYSPNGKSLATGDVRGYVRLFDVTTGEPLIEMKEHTGRVEFLRFSPDGTHLAAASPEDGRVVVWHSAWPKR